MSIVRDDKKEKLNTLLNNDLVFRETVNATLKNLQQDRIYHENQVQKSKERTRELAKNHRKEKFKNLLIGAGVVVGGTLLSTVATPVAGAAIMLYVSAKRKEMIFDIFRGDPKIKKSEQKSKKMEDRAEMTRNFEEKIEKGIRKISLDISPEQNMKNKEKLYNIIQDAQKNVLNENRLKVDDSISHSKESLFDTVLKKVKAHNREGIQSVNTSGLKRELSNHIMSKIRNLDESDDKFKEKATLKLKKG